MTLNDWLNVALRDLAPAAQHRMTAEYHAHVQDAMHSGLSEPEAVASLGDPAQVNRALRRTQLTVQDERWLRTNLTPATSLPAWRSGLLATRLLGAVMLAACVLCGVSESKVVEVPDQLFITVMLPSAACLASSLIWTSSRLLRKWPTA